MCERKREEMQVSFLEITYADMVSDSTLIQRAFLNHHNTVCQAGVGSAPETSHFNKGDTGGRSHDSNQKAHHFQKSPSVVLRLRQIYQDRDLLTNQVMFQMPNALLSCLKMPSD